MTERDRPLTEPEKKEFWDIHGHLAHRYTMLWTHKEKIDNKKQNEYCNAICAFESALVACRVFLEFLGLGIDYNPNLELAIKHKYFSRDGRTTDEVKVVDLGGTFPDLKNIPFTERKVLATVYHMAHKATAHFTYGSPFMAKPDIVHSAIPIIDRLLRKHLYDKNGISPQRHWQ